MSTRLTSDPRLGETVRVFAAVEDAIAANPPWMFRTAIMLVIDGGAWITADLDVIRTGLIPKRRKFKDPFSDRKIPWAVVDEIEKLVVDADRLFGALYPDFEVAATQESFRPMITAGEPLHFDTRPGRHQPYVTSFINVAASPRVYGVGPTLYQLVEREPDLMRDVLRESRDPDDVSLVLRQRTMAGKPPLGANCPRHRVELAPGSVWLFDAKTVSHEVVYGAGALARSWIVPHSGVAQQAEVLTLLSGR
jgi:hypothetical protein